MQVTTQAIVKEAVGLGSFRRNPDTSCSTVSWRRKSAPNWESSGFSLFLASSRFLIPPRVFLCVPSGPTGDAPMRNTRLGWVRGKQAAVLGSAMPVNVFLGVPFAAPPLGPLRFTNPQPMLPWNGFRDATSYPQL